MPEAKYEEGSTILWKSIEEEHWKGALARANHHPVRDNKHSVNK